MQVIALVSGGKDSCYAVMQCMAAGHQIIAMASLLPPASTEDEIDSHCFQTIGHQLLPSLAACIPLPLHTRRTAGRALQTALQYTPTADDEVEDLYALVSSVLALHPTASAVCSGAILSHYQRLRVESVCRRLGLTSLAPLWQRLQRPLLREMIDSGVQAIIVKAASMGLGRELLGKTVGDSFTALCGAEDKYAVNVCGEGGEYETLVLDCPLFRAGRLIIDDAEVVSEGGDIAPVSILRVRSWHREEKQETHAAVPVSLPHPLQTVVSSSTKPCAVISSPLISLPTDWLNPSARVSGFFPPVRVVDDALVFVSTGHSLPVAGSDSAAEQLDGALLFMLSQLASRGFSASELLSVSLSLPSMAAFASCNAAYAQHMPASSPPSRCTVQLPSPSLLCDGIGSSVPSHLRSSLHVQSLSHWAPACIGPYSQSASCSILLFQAGQIALRPFTMRIETAGAQEVQAVMRNCEAVLTARRSGLQSCITTAVWLATDDAEVEREVLQHVDGACSGGVVWLYAAALPRQAVVEVQQLAHQASADFRPVHSCVRQQHAGFTLHAQSSVVPETFLSLLLSLLLPDTTSAAPAALSACVTALLRAVRASASAAVLRLSGVWVVRVYYLLGMDVAELERLMESGWREMLTGEEGGEAGKVESQMPAVSWFPVLGLRVDGGRSAAVLSVHCIFWNIADLMS